MNPFLEEFEVKNQSCENENTSLNSSDDSNITAIISLDFENNTDLIVLDTNKNDLSVVFTQEDDCLIINDSENEFTVDFDTSDTEKPNFLKNPCPIGKTFEEYRSDMRMKEVSKGVYKKVIKTGFGPIIDLSIHKVVYEFSMFLQSLENAFDSNMMIKRYGVIHLSAGYDSLEGIHQAVSSMKFNEESIFWLSYELMYGPLGIFPRIPAKSDILARIKIYKLFDNEGNEIKAEISTFEKTVQATAKACHQAMKFIDSKNFDPAIAIYRKWIDILEKTHLADETEESEMKKHLIKMYLNLSLCYNKVENPQKTCLALRDLEKLTSIKNNPKALFAKGKALMMLNEHKEARNLFYSALKLEPKNQKIKETIQQLQQLQRQKAKYKAEKSQLEAKSDEISRTVNVENNVYFKDEQMEKINKYFESIKLNPYYISESIE